jgi:hypothetical protein
MDGSDDLYEDYEDYDDGDFQSVDVEVWASGY